MSLLDREAAKRRCAERVKLIPLIWPVPTYDPQEIAGFLSDIALEEPWENRYKEFPTELDLTLKEYQRYYTGFIDLMLNPATVILDMRAHSEKLRRKPQA